MNKIIIIVTAVVGVILTVVGAIVLFAVLPKTIESKVADEMYIQKGTEAYERFEELSVPLQWKMYFFQIDDPTQWNGANLTSLKFKQKGPYVYKETRNKTDIKFDDTGNTVSYHEKKYYEFDAKESNRQGCANCTKDDLITLVHVGLGMERVFLGIFEKSFSTFTITDTVQNIAFNGVAGLLGKSLFTCPETEDKCKPMRVVGTGKDNIDHLGILYQYGESKGHSEFWSKTAHNTSTSTCNAIRGTDATQFHPNVKDDQTLWVYENMLCRSIKFVKGLSDQEHQGISTLRFYTDDSNFAASQENQCFCYETNHADCPAGTLNLRNCPPADAPPIEVIASQPFFMSNQDLIDEAGLGHLIKDRKKELTQENYGTIVDVEPYTGIVLSARKRLMTSVMLKKGTHPLLMNLAKDRMYAPLLWIEEAGDVDKVNADKLKDKIFGPKKTFTGLLIGVMALGVLLLAAAGGCAFFNRR